MRHFPHTTSGALLSAPFEPQNLIHVVINVYLLQKTHSSWQWLRADFPIFLSPTQEEFVPNFQAAVLVALN